MFPLQKPSTSGKQKNESIPPINLISNDKLIKPFSHPFNYYHFPPINIHHDPHNTFYPPSGWIFYPHSNMIPPNFIYSNYRPIQFQEDVNQLTASLNDYKPSAKRKKRYENNTNETIFIEHSSSDPSSKKIIHSSSNKKHNENEQKRREKISNYIFKLSTFLNCRKKSTLYVLSSIEEYIRKTRLEIAEDEKRLNSLLEENKNLRLLLQNSC